MRRQSLAIAAVAAVSALPPYVAPLDVADRVEIVDHVVPAAVAAIAALAAGGALGGLAVCVLTGLWEVLTHLTLALDAGDPGRPAGRVAVHVLPGVALLLLSGWALWRHE